MAHLAIPFEFKIAETGAPAGTITGYGSVFGNVDLGGDVIQPGAFRESLAKRAGKPLPMLFGHDTMFPIGVWTELVEDNRGLKVNGRLILDSAPGGAPAVPKAYEAIAALKAGAIDGLSIGYAVTEDSSEVRDGQSVRVITGADLYEISLVVVPMNEAARVESAKSADERLALDALSLIRRGYDFHAACRIAEHSMDRSGGGLTDVRDAIVRFQRSLL